MKPAARCADDRFALRLLRQGAIERRRGGWRFGTARIGAVVIARLLDSGAVVQRGERIVLSSGETSGDPT